MPTGLPPSITGKDPEQAPDDFLTTFLNDFMAQRTARPQNMTPLQRRQQYNMQVEAEEDEFSKYAATAVLGGTPKIDLGRALLAGVQDVVKQRKLEQTTVEGDAEGERYKLTPEERMSIAIAGKEGRELSPDLRRKLEKSRGPVERNVTLFTEGFLNNVLFGVPKLAEPEAFMEPKGSMEEISSGFGELVGMIAGPFKGSSKVTKAIFTRPVKTATGAFFNQMAKTTATLAMGNFAATWKGENVGEVIKNKFNTIPDSIKTGVIFGAAGNVANVFGKNYPWLDRIARFGIMSIGTDLIDGRVPFTKDQDMLKTIYRYGLNAYFARHGVNPKQVLEIQKQMAYEAKKAQDAVQEDRLPLNVPNAVKEAFTGISHGARTEAERAAIRIQNQPEVNIPGVIEEPYGQKVADMNVRRELRAKAEAAEAEAARYRSEEERLFVEQQARAAAPPVQPSLPRVEPIKQAAANAPAKAKKPETAPATAAPTLPEVQPVSEALPPVKPLKPKLTIVDNPDQLPDTVIKTEKVGKWGPVWLDESTGKEYSVRQPQTVYEKKEVLPEVKPAEQVQPAAEVPVAAGPPAEVPARLPEVRPIEEVPEKPVEVRPSSGLPELQPVEEVPQVPEAKAPEVKAPAVSAGKRAVTIEGKPAKPIKTLAFGTPLSRTLTSSEIAYLDTLPRPELVIVTSDGTSWSKELKTKIANGDAAVIAWAEARGIPLRVMKPRWKTVIDAIDSKGRPIRDASTGKMMKIEKTDTAAPFKLNAYIAETFGADAVFFEGTRNVDLKKQVEKRRGQVFEHTRKEVAPTIEQHTLETYPIEGYYDPAEWKKGIEGMKKGIPADLGAVAAKSKMTVQQLMDILPKIDGKVLNPGSAKRMLTDLIEAKNQARLEIPGEFTRSGAPIVYVKTTETIEGKEVSGPWVLAEQVEGIRPEVTSLEMARMIQSRAAEGVVPVTKTIKAGMISPREGEIQPHKTGTETVMYTREGEKVVIPKDSDYPALKSRSKKAVVRPPITEAIEAPPVPKGEEVSSDIYEKSTASEKAGKIEAAAAAGRPDVFEAGVKPYPRVHIPDDKSVYKIDMADPDLAAKLENLPTETRIDVPGIYTTSRRQQSIIKRAGGIYKTSRGVFNVEAGLWQNEMSGAVMSSSEVAKFMKEASVKEAPKYGGVKEYEPGKVLIYGRKDRAPAAVGVGKETPSFLAKLKAGTVVLIPKEMSGEERDVRYVKTRGAVIGERDEKGRLITEEPLVTGGAWSRIDEGALSVRTRTAKRPGWPTTGEILNSAELGKKIYDLKQKYFPYKPAQTPKAGEVPEVKPIGEAEEVSAPRVKEEPGLPPIPGSPVSERPTAQGVPPVSAEAGSQITIQHPNGQRFKGSVASLTPAEIEKTLAKQKVGTKLELINKNGGTSVLTKTPEGWIHEKSGIKYTDAAVARGLADQSRLPKPAGKAQAKVEAPEVPEVPPVTEAVKAEPTEEDRRVAEDLKKARKPRRAGARKRAAKAIPTQEELDREYNEIEPDEEARADQILRAAYREEALEKATALKKEERVAAEPETATEEISLDEKASEETEMTQGEILAEQSKSEKRQAFENEVVEAYEAFSKLKRSTKDASSFIPSETGITRWDVLQEITTQLLMPNKDGIWGEDRIIPAKYKDGKLVREAHPLMGNVLDWMKAAYASKVRPTGVVEEEEIETGRTIVEGEGESEVRTPETIKRKVFRGTGRATREGQQLTEAGYEEGEKGEGKLVPGQKELLYGESPWELIQGGDVSPKNRVARQAMEMQVELDRVRDDAHEAINKVFMELNDATENPRQQKLLEEMRYIYQKEIEGETWQEIAAGLWGERELESGKRDNREATARKRYKAVFDKVMQDPRYKTWHDFVMKKHLMMGISTEDIKRFWDRLTSSDIAKIANDYRKRWFTYSRGNDPLIVDFFDQMRQKISGQKVSATSYSMDLLNALRGIPDEMTVKGQVHNAMKGQFPIDQLDISPEGKAAVQFLRELKIANSLVIDNQPGPADFKEAVHARLDSYLTRLYRAREYPKQGGLFRYLTGKSRFKPTGEDRENFKRALMDLWPYYRQMSEQQLDDWVDNAILHLDFDSYMVGSYNKQNVIPPETFKKLSLFGLRETLARHEVDDNIASQIRSRFLQDEPMDDLPLSEELRADIQKSVNYRKAYEKVAGLIGPEAGTYVYLKTIEKTAEARFMGEYFTWIHDNWKDIVWTDDLRKHGGWVLNDIDAKNPKWGALANYDNVWLEPNFYRFINREIKAQTSNIMKYYEKYMLNPWKFGKVVLSVPAYARDVLGSTMFSIFTDTFLLNPNNRDYYRRAVKAFMQRDKSPEGRAEWERLVGYGATEVFFVGEEVDNLARAVERLEPPDFIEKMLKMPRWAADKAGNAFMGKDAIYRIAAFYKMTEEKGMTPEEALAELDISTPNYRKLPEVVRLLRTVPIFGPMVSFKFNVAKIMAAQLVQGARELRAGLGYGPMLKGRGTWRGDQIGEGGLRSETFAEPEPSREPGATPIDARRVFEAREQERVKNSRLVARGMSRISKVFLAAALPEMMQFVMKKVYHIDDEEIKRIESLMPEYMRGGTYIYVRDKEGKIKAWDSTYTWPTGDWSKTIKNAGVLDFKALSESLNLLESPLRTTANIIADGVDVRTGKQYPSFWDKMGFLARELYVPSSAPIPSWSTVKQFAKTGKFEPRGGPLTPYQMQNIINAYWGDATRGQTLDSELLGFFTGIRTWEANLEQFEQKAAAAVKAQVRKLDEEWNKYKRLNAHAPAWEKKEKLENYREKRLELLKKYVGIRRPE